MHTIMSLSCLLLSCLFCCAELSSEMLLKPPPPPPPPLVAFSAGFTDNAVLQRGSAGVRVYGFAYNDSSIEVTVNGNDGSGTPVSYSVKTQPSAWLDTSGCNETKCIFPSTHPMPAHGNFTWQVSLKPHSAGGNLSLTVATSASAPFANSSVSIQNVTFGDVYFCSGQSNMALQTVYTFSVEDLQAEILAGKYHQIRTYMYGGMSTRYETPSPQFVSTWDTDKPWDVISESAAAPLTPDSNRYDRSHFGMFSATCMYFGAELINAKADAGFETDVPIGLIQSAVGGTQIEEWMSNSSRAICSDLSPKFFGRLYYGMIAPFVNYSVSAWLWYQGENNCHGTMGNVIDNVGYGCALPSMVNSWRDAWFRIDTEETDPRLFGVATLAAGGSEGSDQHMAGMRWSQTANFGRWTDNPLLPSAFGAQAYDIGDPWSHAGDGNPRVMNMTACALGKCAPELDSSGLETLACCWRGITNCTNDQNKTMNACADSYNCSLPEPATGLYGSQCISWNESQFLPTMQSMAAAVKKNAPSGTPGWNFMGGLHPRLKRPLGQRLAYAAVRAMKWQQLRKQESLTKITDGAVEGPTIEGCQFSDSTVQIPGKLVVSFNATLLGGEGLLLRNFDANTTGGWNANPYNDSASKYHPYPKQPVLDPTWDSLGMMVCTVDPLYPGNESTCQCQGWSYELHNTSGNNGKEQLEAFWYCSDGPGWKPPANEFAAKIIRRANPFKDQWRPAEVHAVPGSLSAVEVDLSSSLLGGRRPVAIRLGWPLFGGFHSTSPDTCCPTRAILDGHGICIPGSCPLYSNMSNLPANPFFATIGSNGKCSCTPPQVCDV